MGRFTSPACCDGDQGSLITPGGSLNHLCRLSINPGGRCRYDPYARVLLREQYDHAGMRRVRRDMVQRAKRPGQVWGLVLGTLGRQGNLRTFDRVRTQLQRHSIPHTLVGGPSLHT